MVIPVVSDNNYNLVSIEFMKTDLFVRNLFSTQFFLLSQRILMLVRISLRK